jgi:hypothetical protein
MAATDSAEQSGAGGLSEETWFLLPPLRLSDGGLARRVSKALDPRTLLSIVLSATGPLVGISFELVEHGRPGPLPPDPRLGRIMVNDRTICFGLVETTRTSMTFTALSVRADAAIVTALGRGNSLSFDVGNTRTSIDLADARAPFQAALRSVCDPVHVPVESWLAST